MEKSIQSNERWKAYSFLREESMVMQFHFGVAPGVGSIVVRMRQILLVECW